MWTLYNRYYDTSFILDVTRKNWMRLPHPSISGLMRDTPSLEAQDWHTFVLEQPSVPENGDRLRVSYWQSERKQAADLRTVTSLGKYLKRHFPTLPDHIIRDVVASAAPAKFEIWSETSEMVRAVTDGPYSCMQWDDETYHPYECYHPGYGWAVAVRLQGQDILGRCLVNNKSKTYVRSYYREAVGHSCTGSDHALEAWLQKQGYSFSSTWPEGHKLALVEGRSSEFILPYIDAKYDEGRCVTRMRDHWVIDQSGEYQCDCTDGTYTEVCRSTCDKCGDRTDDEDLTWIDSEEMSICSSCVNRHYTYVIGTRNSSRGATSHYYVRDDEAARVNGEDYDVENLPDYIVCLHDGEYAHVDETVCYADEYYLEDDCDSRHPDRRRDVLLVCLHDGEYALADDSAWCEENEDWYLQDDCREFLDGTWVCEDDAEDYLNGLSKEELLDKVESGEAEQIMASDDWEGEVEPVALPEPATVDVPVAASLNPAEAYLKQFLAENTLSFLPVGAAELDYADLERRVIASGTCTTASTSTGQPATINLDQFMDVARRLRQQGLGSTGLFGFSPFLSMQVLPADAVVRIVDSGNLYSVKDK